MNIFTRLVDHFGSQELLAEAVGVNQSNVSKWVRGKQGMSPKTAIRIEKATNGLFTKEELCPQTFGELSAA